MTKIEINDIIYHIHPIYNLYGANEAGNIIHIIKKTPIVSKHKPRKKDSVCMVRAYGQSCYKTILTSNFIWECFNGIIPDDKVIDHINDNAEDNRLCNLQLVTKKENNRLYESQQVTCFNIHPIYDLYGADIDGNIIHIIKKIPNKGHKNDPRGYMMCTVRKHGQNGQKSMFVHRFVWECFNGLIPGDKVIDHINDNAEDNRLCNLKLVTQQENCKKSAKKRDYTFVKYNHENKRCIKAINQSTEEVTNFNSMYAAQQHLSINVGIIKMVCENLNNCKSGISKKDGQRYIFEYIKADELPKN